MVEVKSYRVWVILLMLVLSLGIAACGGEAPSESAQATAEAATAATTAATPEGAAEVTGAGQPVSPLSVDSPLAAPASPLPPPASLPHPTSETGSIAGRIIVKRPQGEIAVSDMILGLASVIRDENGTPKVSGYEQASAVRTTTDPYGRFVLDGVKPGTYTLILDAVLTQYQLEDEKTGNTILVEVKANEVSDVGTIEYTSLPLPGMQ